MRDQYPTVLDLFGRTPLVRLQRIGRNVEPLLLAKLEFMNPGGSVKDRIGLRMIEQAEQEGKLRPGGTIVEPTSGNTGVGLAIAAALKGYECVFVMPDKIAEEKRALLRAFGAEVVICPTAVAPESPESYYSVSDRLAEEIPGAFKPDQYSNPANPLAHYETTGPELWEQTDGQHRRNRLLGRHRRDDHGRGPLPQGAEPGSARRRRRPGGVDLLEPRQRPHLPGGGHRRGLLAERPTTPRSWTSTSTVSDRDSFRTARRLAREEGLLVGGSGGTAVWAMLQVARALRPRRDDRHAHPRLRPRLPLEVLRRQLAARARLPRAEGARSRRSRRC